MRHAIVAQQESDRTSREYCMLCGAEAKELPTECPGKSMTQSQKNAVALGDADYHNGAWHRTEKAKA